MLTEAHNKEFSRWRRRSAKNLPELATRVFALRHTMYPGCGLHWAMERELGYVMAKLNDYDDGDMYHGHKAEASQMVLQIRLEMLYRDVRLAEQKART